MKVLMHGPGIRNPEEMQEREIVESDVQAYVAIGWQKGPLPKGAKVEDVEAPAAQPSVDPVREPVNIIDETEPKAKPKAKKGKK